MLGTPDSYADFSATVNGYKYFCDSLENSDDPLTTINPLERGMFSAGNKNVRMYHLKMGTGGLVFNYAIDASWQFPMGEPPWEAPEDFTSAANAPEPWFISTTIIENSLWNDGVDSGGHLQLEVTAYDWFASALTTLSIESPGNFDPLIDDPPLGISEVSGWWEFDTGNASPEQDSIDILLTVKCESTGYGGLLPGTPVASYMLMTVPVNDEPLEPQEFKGWGGFGYNAENTSFNPELQDFDYSNYSEKWYTEDIGYTRTGIAISEDYVYASSCMGAFTNDEHHLTCYDINDGSVKWTKLLNPTCPGGATFYSYTSPYYFVEYNVGKVVIGGDRVWCFNAVTGNIEWEYGLVGWNFSENSPKYYDGKIYITGEPDPWENKAALHCIDASDGSYIWASAPTTGSTYSVPAVKDGYVYWGMYGKIYCVDADTGVLQWMSSHGLSAFDCMTILGDRLYFVQFNEQLVCLDATNGDLIWEWDEPMHTGSVMHAFSPVLTHWYDTDGKPVLCFRAEENGGLHAIRDDGASASMLWCWGQNSVSVYGSPVYNDGIVYFGEGASDYLLGLDASTGN